MSGESLKTVERTLALLKLFNRTDSEMTVADLVRRSRMPRAVVQRIIFTLEREGFLERSPISFRYRIGVAACELGALYLAGNPLVQSSDAILRQLAGDAEFPVYLGTRIGAEVTILALHQGQTAIRFLWSPGDRLPVATTALGKAMLMHLDPAVLDSLIGRGVLPGLSAQSIRTRAELDAQLDNYRARGWVPAFEESLPGVYAIGAAILSDIGAPLAGISVSFLRNESDAGQLERIGSLVLEAAAAISERSGILSEYGSRPTIPKIGQPDRRPSPL
jgi:DNA-binding IclR family transcriptional regulator